MKFLVAVYSSDRQFVYDTDNQCVIDTRQTKINWNEVINVKFTGSDVEYLYGCKYALRDYNRNIKQLLKNNFVMREVYSNKLIGYEVVCARLRQDGKGVTWESKMVSIREAVELHKRYNFSNVKLIKENGKTRLIPKYGTLERISYNGAPVQKEQEDTLASTERKISKALDKYDATDKRVVYMKDKVKRGFANRAIAAVMLGLIVTGAAAGAVKTPVLNNRADSRVVATVNTNKNIKSAFDAAASLSLADSVVCMDNKVFKDGSTIAYLEQDRINSIDLKAINGDTILEYTSDRGLEGKTSIAGGKTDIKVEYTMLGVASFKFSRGNKDITVTSNKITVDGKDVYTVKNDRNGVTISKTEKSSVDMTEAVTLILGVGNWNEQLKIDSMKAE